MRQSCITYRMPIQVVHRSQVTCHKAISLTFFGQNRLENIALSCTVFFQFNFIRKYRFMTHLLLSFVEIFNIFNPQRDIGKRGNHVYVEKVNISVSYPPYWKYCFNLFLNQKKMTKVLFGKFNTDNWHKILSSLLD